MKRGDSTAPQGARDEISTLIATLHATGQRLEDLTSGEVDAVVDRNGESFLLRHAQHRLRVSESAKQLAILSALPANIALLDAASNIIAVNEAWRQFAKANGDHLLGAGIGLNYLDVCDAATGDYSAEARQVSAGLRSVLSGCAGTFSIEYPCHSQTERRWFLLTATPLADHVGGAVVMHVNITERKHDEEALWRLGAAMDSTADAIYLVDRSSMRFMHVNDAACRMQHLKREELIALGPAGVLAISREALERTYDDVIATGVAEPLEVLRHRKNGARAWIEIRRHAQRSADGWMIVTLARDVTERKESEERIRRLNRMHAVLSGINALIVRVRDRDELFRGACQIAVEQGEFRLSWIGMVDRAAMQIVPAASAGADDGFVDAARARLSLREDAPAGHGLSAVAAREKQVVVSNDVKTDSRILDKRAHSDRGFASMIILPLVIADETVAVFHLHAAESGYFDEAEMLLLRDLAGNIAFAIDHIEKQERLDYFAYYDAITGLANRTLFLERVAQYVRSAVRDGHGLAVFLIDLERFKNINDSLGRSSGDALLRQVAEWLTVISGDAHLSARVDADHFAVVMPHVKPGADLAQFSETTLSALLEHPFRIENAVFRIAAKMGVALFPEDGSDAETLLMNAEAALKKAKGGGDRFLFYTQKMTETTARTLTLENQLRRALDNEEFVLHYQPKVNLISGKVTGAEALIRWNDPETGLVPPGRFIPVLEETGLIHQVGRWALREAVSDHLRWREAEHLAVRIAVNVSPLQLRHRGFIAEVEREIGIDANAGAGLELEITESMIMADIKQCIATLEAIRAMGIHIAIDDFGTGFSSLGYLSKLPIDTLKIDRTFVNDMTVTQQGLTLVSTIINLAHSLKLKVVAEGVETEEQQRLLRLLDCDEMQGYLFGRPVAREVFEATYLRPKSPARNR